MFDTHKSLKIVFITNNYTPYSGGVVSSINAQVLELIKMGHQVFIIAPDFLGAGHRDPNYVLRITCPIKFRYRTNHMAIPWRMGYQVEQLVKELKPDIIHTHHPWLLGSAGLKVARKLQIPLVFTYHTLYDHYAHYLPVPQAISRPIINYLVKKYCAVVNGIIAPSSAVQEKIASYGISTPCMVLPSPLAIEFINQSNIQKTKSPGQPFRLLVVSRLVKEKNIPFILAVFAELIKNYPHEFHLTIVGYGAYASYLKQYAYEVLNLSPEAVFFEDKKGKQELIPFYQAADLFLFSSLSDTQGLVLAESMSCGTPVIALDGPGQRDIVKNGFNGFLVNDRQEMAEIIRHIEKDRQLYDRLVKGAYETAQNYAPSLLAQKLIAWYKSFLRK